jgi:hypothetical protein
MKKLFFILFIGLFIVTIKSSAQTEVIDVDDWVIISPTFPDNPANDNLFTKDFGKTPKVSSRSSVKPELTIYVESIDDYVAFKVGPKGQISNIFTSSKSKLKVENAVKAVIITFGRPSVRGRRPGRKGLISHQYQTILPSSGSPLVECRLNARNLRRNIPND